MRKIFKIGLWLLGLFCLVVVLLLSVLLLQDPNDYREEVAEAFQEQTGLVMTDIGRIELDYYPWLDLRLEEVVIQGAEGYQGEPLARLRGARVRVKLFSLLFGTPYMDTVQLHGAEFHLVKDASGRANWEPRDAAAARSDADDGAASAFGDALAFVIGGLDVRDVNLQWRDESAGRRVQIDALNLKSDALAVEQPMTFQGDFGLQVTPGSIKGKGDFSATVTYADEQVSGEGGLQLSLEGGRKFETSMQFSSDLEEGVTEFRGFSLRGPAGLNADGGFLLNAAARQPELRGSLRLQVKDTLELLRIAGLEQAAAAAAKLSSRELDLQVQALEVAPAASPFRITGLAAKLLGAELRADLEGKGLFTPRKLAARGKVTLKVPDVPTLTAFLASLPGLTAVEPLGVMAKRMAGLSKPRAAVLELDLDLDLAPSSMRLDLPRLEGNLLGLQLQGMVSGDAEKLSGRMALTTERPGVLGVLAGNQELGRHLRSLHMEATLAGSAERLRFKPLSLRLVPKAGQGAESVTVTARGMLQPAETRLQLESLNAAGLGLAVTGRLDARWETDEALPRADGALSVPEFNPTQLLRILGLEKSLPSGEGVLRKLALETEFKSDGKNLNIPRLQLTLDQSKLNGQVEFDYSSRPRLAFKLDLDRMNLDSYLPPATKEETGDQADAAPLEFSEEQLRLLAGLTLDGSLRAGELLVRGVRLQELQATLRGQDGLFSLEPLSAKLYEGSANLNLRADVSKPAPPVSMEAKLEGVQVGPLLKDLSGKNTLSGLLRAQVQLEGAGAGVPAILQSLNGDLGFRVNEGSLRGVNIAHRMRQWKFFSGLLKGRAELPPEERKTDFTELSATGQVTQGTLRNEDLQLLSPVLEVRGQGELNLPLATADYSVSAALLGSSAGNKLVPKELRGIKFPIRIQGPLADLEYGFDYKQLLATGVKDAIIDQLKDKLKLPGVGGLLGGSEAKDKEEDKAEQPEKKEQVKDQVLEGLKKLF